jgi:glycerol-3-phosphate dehydrogenase
VPWKGVVLIGTTDVDQDPLMAEDKPYTSSEEVEFLLSGLQARFPTLNLSIRDIQAVFAGIRPVVDARTADPTKASREHVILYESGLLTVVGGKMTTFHAMALDAFEKLRQHIPSFRKAKGETFALDPLPDLPMDFPVELSLATDWLSRYGESSLDFLCASTEADRLPIRGGYGASPADLRWILRHESVHHLEDLLLRRTRLGLTAREGGNALLPQVRSVVQEELNWTDSQWEKETARYLNHWKKTYSVPPLT